ncbi:nucleotidyltransferase substrate binding protein [Desulforamulus putei]|uniref:Nucleotidyltransferase substrate binding protein, HI0074 family n=1 Tax=Desulforamulus putei DSM 12395 TaxID=1121429 RepID=A0A1M5B5E6_9FIRM|nr:nucleotidyltransferase substrate binding protein [Desulforamulus putei]SHF37699.1 nucleotidyltransferase substrate binding protein, HI0074 family [Desulforamulus putei DSM 12395]
METKKEELAFHISRLERALATLDEILEQPFSVIIRDATIQRFEYCFELSWKLLKKALKIDGIDVNSPRQTIRAAFETGYIDDIDIWFEMLEDRNMTSHTYDPDIANQVYESANRLPEEIRKVLKILAKSR